MKSKVRTGILAYWQSGAACGLVTYYSVAQDFLSANGSSGLTIFVRSGMLLSPPQNVKSHCACEAFVATKMRARDRSDFMQMMTMIVAILFRFEISVRPRSFIVPSAKPVGGWTACSIFDIKAQYRCTRNTRRDLSYSGNTQTLIDVQYNINST